MEFELHGNMGERHIFKNINVICLSIVYLSSIYVYLSIHHLSPFLLISKNKKSYHSLALTVLERELLL